MTGTELSWADAKLAWLFLGVLLAAILVAAHFQWKASVIRRLGDRPLIRRMTADVSLAKQIWKWGLMLLAATLVITALLRPQYGTREAELKNRGIDIVVALDLSKSMMVRDVAPNRLKAAVVEINDLIDRLTGGRVALVPFAGTAFTQTPLTTDFDAVRSYLEQLRVEDMPIGGTRIANAIRHALTVFERSEEEPNEDDPDADLEQPQASHFKAIILVTDGEDQDKDAIAAAQAAAGANVRIYTVGIGSQSSAGRIPVLSSDGERVGWVSDKDNKPVFSDLNVALLRDIASAANGVSLIYGQDDVAGELATAIDGLEKREYEHHYDNLKEDRFQWVLAVVLLLLVLESWITDRRRGTRMRRASA